MENGNIAAGPSSVNKFARIVALLFVIFSSLTPAGAHDPLDPNGNITIKWDVIQWTADGNVAVVTMFNFQQYRHTQAPGWRLGWKWAKTELIWSVVGGQVTDQGDCSRFKFDKPYSCRKDPTIIGLLPGNSNHATSFQITVGFAGNTVRTINPPLTSLSGLLDLNTLAEQ